MCHHKTVTFPRENFSIVSLIFCKIVKINMDWLSPASVALPLKMISDQHIIIFICSNQLQLIYNDF